MIARTALLLAALTALFGAIGYLVGGTGGMMMALGVAAAMNLFAYWNSGAIVLRMYRAEEVDPTRAPELYDLTARLARRAQMPMPRLYVIHEAQPNAFATGRNPENGVVAVTTGLLELLNQDEVAGVIAHELAHIKHRDTLMMTITATLAGAIGMLANFAMFFGTGRDENGQPTGNPLLGLLIALLAPMMATMVQFAISRSREYEADRGGAEFCGNPRALASALDKIQAYAEGRINLTAERNPATAHMFILNPLSGVGMDNLFSTHPSTRNRIERLLAMTGGVDGGAGGGMDAPARSRLRPASRGSVPDSGGGDGYRDKRGPWS